MQVLVEHSEAAMMFLAALCLAATLVHAQGWGHTANQGLTHDANKELLFLDVGNLTASDNNDLFMNSQAPDLCAPRQSNSRCRHNSSSSELHCADATSGPRCGASRSKTRLCAVSRTT